MGKPLSRPDCLRRGPRCLGKRDGEDGGIEDCYIPQRSIYDTVRINEHIDQGSASSTLGSGGGEGNTLSTNGTLGTGSTTRPGSGRKLDEKFIFDSLKLSVEPHGEGGASVSPSSSSNRNATNGDRRDSNNRRSWKTLLPPEFVECIEVSSEDIPPEQCTTLSTFKMPCSVANAQTPVSSPQINTGTILICDDMFKHTSDTNNCSEQKTMTQPPSPIQLHTESGSVRNTAAVVSSSHQDPIKAWRAAMAADSESECTSPVLEQDSDTAPLLPLMLSSKPANLSPTPTERTWPRRLLGRRRTVSQGGVLHNFPILPPLPPLLAEHSIVEEERASLLALGCKKGSVLQQLEEEDEGDLVDEGDWAALLRQVDSLWEEPREELDLSGWDLGHMGSLSRWPVLRPPAGFGGSEPPSGPGSELGSDDAESEEISSDQGIRAGEEEHKQNSFCSHKTCVVDTLSSGILNAVSTGNLQDNGSLQPNISGVTKVSTESLAVIENVSMETQTMTGISISLKVAEYQQDNISEVNTKREGNIKNIPSGQHKPLDKGIMGLSKKGTDSPMPLSPSRHDSQETVLLGKEVDAFVATDSFVYLAVSALPPVPQESTAPSLEGSEPASPAVLPLPWPEESDFLSTDSFVYLAAPERLNLATDHSSANSANSSSAESQSGVDFVLGSMTGDSDWDSDGPTWDYWDELEPSVLQELFCDYDWEQVPQDNRSSECRSTEELSDVMIETEIGTDGLDHKEGKIQTEPDAELKTSPSQHQPKEIVLTKTHVLRDQFMETLGKLEPWLTQMEDTVSQLPHFTISSEVLRQQQDQLRVLRETVTEHHAYVVKLQLIGPQLAEISGSEAEVVRQHCGSVAQRYLAVKDTVRIHGSALEEAALQSSQFQEKVSSLLETLERAVQRLRKRPPVAVEMDKIHEQLAVHRAAGLEMDKLLPTYVALSGQGEDLALREDKAHPAAQTVQLQLQRLQGLWEEIRQRADEREETLLQVLELAGSFWAEVESLRELVCEAQSVVRELGAPSVDPILIKHQMEIVEGIGEEVEKFWQRLDGLRSTGSSLIAACGETDKQQVDKAIEEINITWSSLRKICEEWKEKLEEALMISLQYQHALQAMFSYLDNALRELGDMPIVGVDLSTVRQQMEEFKLYRDGVYQQQISMESLNQQGAILLKKVSTADDQNKIKEPLTALRNLWDHLGNKIKQRQHQLEGALMAQGQFHYALSELHAWLVQGHNSLDLQQPISCDPRAIEMELAKNRVLKKELLARGSTLESISTAGWELLESSLGGHDNPLHEQLERLNHNWESLLLNAQAQQKLLEASLQKADRFQAELEDATQWLLLTETQLAEIQPTGGLPETAREQLQRHMVLQEELLQRAKHYHQLLDQRETILLAHGGEGEGGLGVAQVLQKLSLLQNKWATLNDKMEERKTRLEQVVALATAFQGSLQVCINWLIQAEQVLNLAQPPSLILDTVQLQIEQHQEFMSGLNSQKDVVLDLEKAGSQLSTASLEQDVILIRSLLLRVHARWDQLVQSSLERNQRLDKARATAEQFKVAWLELWEWLQEAENQLDVPLEMTTEPEKIKLLLAQYKDFQRVLWSKRPAFYTTVRSCRDIMERATLPADTLKLGNLLGKIRDKWDCVCGRSVDRQQQLDEVVMQSGQISAALEGMVDWLLQIEPQLAEEQPVHGDLALVAHLVDSHKVLQQEISKRAESVQALSQSAMELLDEELGQTIWLRILLQDLNQRWDRVCMLSADKQARLQHALQQAEEFRSSVQRLRAWLSGAEQSLRLRGVLPEEPDSLRVLLHSQAELVQALEEKRQDVDRAVSVGVAILHLCHPDGRASISHACAGLQARYQEVLTWAKQHEQRLERALAELQGSALLLDNIQSWLQWADARLAQQESEPLPRDVLQMRARITEHQAFMEEVTRKQGDISELSKTYPWKTAGNPSSLSDRLRACKHYCSQWQQLWQRSYDRQSKLSDALYRLEELKEDPSFDFDMWRERYMRWLTYRRASIMDGFLRIDKDQDGQITRLDFTEAILAINFPTNQLELSAVADMFDQEGNGHIDYYKFVGSLLSKRDKYRMSSDSKRIEDEVFCQVAQCRCLKRVKVELTGKNRYKFWDRECQVKLVLGVVMVQLEGGWIALDQVMLKYDHCRGTGAVSSAIRRTSRKRGVEL